MATLVIRFTVLTVLLSLFPAWLSADAGHDLSVGPNHSVIDARLAPDAFPRGASFGLPQFRGYDANGDQVFDTGQGFETESFEKELNATLTRPQPTGAATSLADEVAKLIDSEGRPISGLPSDQVVLVKYWADWCLPCRFQARAVERVLKKHPEMSITVLNVEADPTKISGVEAPSAKVSARELPADYAPESVVYRVIPKALEDSITGGESLESKIVLERLMAKMQKGEIPMATLMPLVESDGKAAVRLLTAAQAEELPDKLRAKIVAGEPLTDAESDQVRSILDASLAAADD